MVGYQRINFKDYPDTSTPITAQNLNKIDKGMYDLDQAMDDLSESVDERLTPITPVKVTTFPSDGSILDTYSATETVQTVFNSDGSISEIHTIDGNVIEHKTIFNSDGSISVVDVPQS
jgi:hypothetical protein